MTMSRIIAAALAAALTGCGSTDAQHAATPAGAPQAAESEAASTSAAAMNAAGSNAAATSTPTSPAAAAGAPADSLGTILFVGTSLTAGYGVGADLAYPAVIQQWVDSAGLPYRVVNGGISGETSAGGLRRMEWSLQSPVDVLVLELGANDGLRGTDPAAMRANLDSIIRLTRAHYPASRIVLVGMEAPPNLGERYTSRFRQVFPELANKYHLPLVPFLLAGVAGVDRLNQNDGLHPTAAGQRLVAGNVWRVLEPVLRKRAR